ncbi:hypothetical protein HPP92_028337, partial [Vanilla planifolia]
KISMKLLLNIIQNSSRLKYALGLLLGSTGKNVKFRIMELNIFSSSLTSLQRLQLRPSWFSSSSSASTRKMMQRCSLTEALRILRACRCGWVSNTDIAQKLLPLTKCQGLMVGVASHTDLMLQFAEDGLYEEAKALWAEIMNSSVVPRFEVVASLVDSYVRGGQFEEIICILGEVTSRGFFYASQLHSATVTCFGSAGKLDMMEVIVKDMVSRGFKVDSCTGNAFVHYYSRFGSIAEMEDAYERLKKSRILIEKEAIRAMALAYITQRKFYHMGEFLRDVGLRRRNIGNLLWNLLLLSFAANFKMKSLQREFLAMLEAGFSPDLVTFNIRALAFTRMLLFWDLHLSIEHMNNEAVVPDLVTYGCVVDAYLDRRLGRNLSFILDKMNVESCPIMLTDPLVFEAFGKGDFHSSSEALLESRSQRKWTYSRLIAVYLKKQHRSNQIFWNY